MGCGCGGESNRYTGSPDQGRRSNQPAPHASGLPKVWTGGRQPVNGPKPK